MGSQRFIVSADGIADSVWRYGYGDIGLWFRGGGTVNDGGCGYVSVPAVEIVGWWRQWGGSHSYRKQWCSDSNQYNQRRSRLHKYANHSD